MGWVEGGCWLGGVRLLEMPAPCLSPAAMGSVCKGGESQRGCPGASLPSPFSYSLTYLKRQLLPCLDFSLISPPGTSVFLRRTHLSGSEDKEENPFYSPKGRTSRSGCNSVCFFHVREPVGVIHTQKYVVNIFQVSGVKLDFKNMTRHS